VAYFFWTTRYFHRGKSENKSSTERESNDEDTLDQELASAAA